MENRKSITLEFTNIELDMIVEALDYYSVGFEGAGVSHKALSEELEEIGKNINV